MNDFVRSPTSTSLNDHFLVVFENNFVAAVDVQHRHRTHLGRHAAWPWCEPGVHRVDQRLHDGVVSGVEVVGQVEGTVAGAVERFVAGRCHDPVVPTDLAEIHVHRPPSTEVASPTPVFSTSPGSRPSASLRMPPTTLFPLGPGLGRRRHRRRQSSKRRDEFSRRAGSVVAVRHEIRPPAIDYGRHRRPVNLSPDDN